MLAALGSLAIALPGCATIFSGTSQSVEVRSAPDGANVVVDGRAVGITPLKTELKRGTPHTIEVNKDGYLKETVVATTKTNSVTALNLVWGGAPGIAIDLLSGSAAAVAPDAVVVDLVEEAQPQGDIRLTGGRATQSAGQPFDLN